MTRVDRRPTVARNFITGDRRSIEWALEQWASMRPPVDHVTLDGEAAFVAATALGLRDLGVLRGVGRSPFALTCRLPSRGGAVHGDGPRALCEASAAGPLRTRDLRDDDVLLIVGTALPDRMRSIVERHPAVALVRPGTRIPKTWRPVVARGSLRIIPVGVDSLGLSPEWEGCLEDLMPKRIVVAGEGEALFASTIACGDFFLERLATLPSPDAAQALVRERVVVLADALSPPLAWKSAPDVWRGAVSSAGADIEESSTTERSGLVLIPERRRAVAA